MPVCCAGRVPAEPAGLAVGGALRRADVGPRPGIAPRSVEHDARALRGAAEAEAAAT